MKSKGSNATALSDFFKKQFLGILALSNVQIRNQALTTETRAGVLRSLAVVVRLVGSSSGQFTSQVGGAAANAILCPGLKLASSSFWPLFRPRYPIRIFETPR
jgi:hypothetical protein